MSITLTWARNLGDPTQVDESIRIHKNILASLEAASQRQQPRAEDLIEHFRKNLATVTVRQEQWADHYRFLCENVLSNLRLEELEMFLCYPSLLKSTATNTEASFSRVR